MKSIKELVETPDFFKDDNVSANSIIGLGIGLLMEEARIPSILDKNYDPNSGKILKYYSSALNKVLGTGTIGDYFDMVGDSAPREKYQYSFKMFLPVLRASLNNTPANLFDALREVIEAEENPHNKTELQLMEIVMLSRLPSQFKKVIPQMIEKIDNKHISSDEWPAYELAKAYFRE